MELDSLWTDIRRWGWARSLFIRVMSQLQRHTGLRIYRVNVRPLVRRAPAPSSLRGITLRVVKLEDLLRAAVDPELDLDSDFVRDALARGDMAFGAFEGDRLVGYTWRTFASAPHVDGLWVRVDRPYQYSYKAFTRPSHRRRRIHVAITFFADTHLLKRGYAAEVGFVEISNFASLAVANFLGRRRIGYAGCVKWLGSRISFRTPAVKKIGIDLFERAPDANLGPHHHVGGICGTSIQNK